MDMRDFQRKIDFLLDTEKPQKDILVRWCMSKGAVNWNISQCEELYLFSHLCYLLRSNDEDTVDRGVKNVFGLHVPLSKMSKIVSKLSEVALVLRTRVLQKITKNFSLDLVGALRGNGMH